MALTIALTGGIGSGKSTLSRMLVGQGAGLIDTDALARELTAPGGAAIDAVRAQFGGEAIGSDGGLDRPLVRARAFSDARWRRRLEALLHPMIWQRAWQAAAELAATCAYVVFDVPLLAESGQRDRRFDRVLVIDCPVELQIERALRRGNLDRAEVDAIVAAQAGRSQRLALADDVVFNGTGMAALEARARRLHALYRDAASAHGGV